MTRTPKAKKRRGSQMRRSADQKIAAAMGNPIRLDALSVLYEREASPKELSRLLRKPLASVSYHVQALAKANAIELVGTESRRGALEHFYRARVAPEISDEEMRAMPKAARRDVIAVILQAIIAEGLASLRHRQMDSDDDLNLCWMPLQLDEQGHQEIKELQNEMYERVAEIKAGSLGRTAGKPDRRVPVRILVFMWFGRGGSLGTGSLRSRKAGRSKALGKAQRIKAGEPA